MLNLIFPTVLAGITAGSIHVVMGPDHLAAVAPLALSQRKNAWLLGIRWGLGHASGVTLVATAAWFFRELFPTVLFSSHSEQWVGVMLVGIGLWGIHKALRFKLHSHTQTHPHPHTALAVGILHGLAGGSHFLGVLPTLAMPTKQAAMLYLLSFGIGTVAAMAGFSLFLGAVGTRIEVLGTHYFKGAMVTCSCFAIVMGGYWLGT